MAGMNSVHLVGRVGDDPEYRKFPNGGEMIEFSLATSETWRDRNTGERKEKTQWHRIKITIEAVVKIASEYVKKGDLVGVEGKLEYRKWENKDGVKMTSAEIIVDFGGRLHLLGSKSGNGDSNSRGSSSNSGRSERRNDDYGSRSGGGGKSSSQRSLRDDLGEDDIPF